MNRSMISPLSRTGGLKRGALKDPAVQSIRLEVKQARRQDWEGIGAYDVAMHPYILLFGMILIMTLLFALVRPLTVFY